MVSRRDFCGIALGAGASLALTPRLLRALRTPRGALLQRAIPSTGEMLPAVGLSFSNHPSCADHAALKEVLGAFVDGGGRVFDAMHVSNPASDRFHATAPRELGVADRLFWSMRGIPGGVAPQPGAAVVRRHVETTLASIGRPAIDLAMLPAAGDPTWLAALQEERRAGRVRHVGVQVIGDNAYPQLEAVMRREPIDFVGVDYDIGNRARVEEVILPLAQERRIAVMAFFPFGNNGGASCGSGSNLFGRVAGRSLPAWAADFDAASWAQFFLKYVLGHPAITVARVGTTKAHHMIDDMAGGVGRLPDEATRRRMAALIDALPPVTIASPPPSAYGPAGSLALSAAVLDRYVGDYRTSNGKVLTFRRYGTTLVAKAGADEARVVHAQTETRFRLGPDVVEFRLDGAGRAVGLVHERRGERIAATRIR